MLALLDGGVDRLYVVFVASLAQHHAYLARKILPNMHISPYLIPMN